ncbi:MAG: cyclic di-AMP binding protein CbpA [Raineya sp.]
MTVQELINPNFKPISAEVSTQKALQWLEELQVKALPVVDEKGVFRGMLAENVLLELWEEQADWENLYLQYNETYLQAHQHWQEAIRLLQHIEIIAVIDENGRYLGVVTAQDVLKKLATLYSFQEEGAILVLALNQYDYSLSEISRLIEANNAKILHLFSEIVPNEPYRIILTLKINQVDITRIVATFERFGYEIIAKFHQAPVFDNFEQDRLGLLMKYLSF